MDRSRIRGCLLGLALGDALAAPFEGDFAARGMWWLLGLGKRGRLRWTDDTQMTLVLAEVLAGGGAIDQDRLAARWAEEARWARGYGPAALKILRRIRRGMPWREASRSVYPDGSFGNGGAMRVAPVGLVFTDREARDAAARASCEVTHAHPHAIEGARLIAEGVHQCATSDAAPELVLQSHEAVFAERLTLRRKASLQDASAKALAKALGNRMTAVDSVVTAIYLYERFRDASFEAMIDFACALRGDTDTIAAMAGALFGAARGAAALPASHLDRLEQCQAIMELADRLAVAIEGAGRL